VTQGADPGADPKLWESLMKWKELRGKAWVESAAQGSDVAESPHAGGSAADECMGAGLPLRVSRWTAQCYRHLRRECRRRQRNAAASTIQARWRALQPVRERRRRIAEAVDRCRRCEKTIGTLSALQREIQWGQWGGAIFRF
jgi:hypothetical protein